MLSQIVIQAVVCCSLLCFVVKYPIYLHLHKGSLLGRIPNFCIINSCVVNRGRRVVYVFGCAARNSRISLQAFIC